MPTPPAPEQAPRPSPAVARAVKRHVRPRRWPLRAACALGLERIAAEELQERFGDRVSGLAIAPGVVRWEVPFDELHAALPTLATIDSLHLRIAELPAQTFPMLAGRLARVPFPWWLPDPCRLEVRTRPRRSRLRDAAGIAKALTGAVHTSGVRLAEADDAAAPGVTLHYRSDRDRAELWLDLLGEPGHRRGGPARPVVAGSVRETTAAALVRIGVPPGTRLLIDPFCGSGTLLQEAIAFLTGRPAGRDRTFAAQALPAWRAGAYRHALRQADAATRPLAAQVIGSDADPEALRAARSALTRIAGNDDRLRLTVADARRIDPSSLQRSVGATGPEQAVLLANPPYGRLARDAGGDTPQRLLAEVLPRFAGFRFALLWPDPDGLRRIAGVQIQRVVPVRLRGFRNALTVGWIEGQGD